MAHKPIMVRLQSVSVLLAILFLREMGVSESIVRTALEGSNHWSQIIPLYPESEYIVLTQQVKFYWRSDVIQILFGGHSSEHITMRYESFVGATDRRHDTNWRTASESRWRL